jgi:hypothetical protein
MRVMPVDAGWMRVTVTPSAAAAAQCVTHPKAMQGAQATFCTAALGRFWV